MPQEERYTWQQFDEDVVCIVKVLRRLGVEFDGVWGPPRGGLVLAVSLSHALGIPMILNRPTQKTLVVDDIADSGQTLAPFYHKNIIVTLYYHRRSIVVPEFWVREKGDAWIVFPWEKKLSTI